MVNLTGPNSWLGGGSLPGNLLKETPSSSYPTSYWTKLRFWYSLGKFSCFWLGRKRIGPGRGSCNVNFHEFTGVLI